MSFFPSIIESQTVDGRLVAMPLYTDAPALFYRKDLLEKYGKEVPRPGPTWLPSPRKSRTRSAKPARRISGVTSSRPMPMKG